jgi:hypothetical protein
MTIFVSAGKRNAGARQCRDGAGWLGLAASPSFALMAWISANDMQAIICAPAPGVLPIGGMAWMYLMMSFFHLPPWLKLASSLSRHQPASQTQGD